jgi:hypothetical protein
MIFSTSREKKNKNETNNPLTILYKNQAPAFSLEIFLLFRLFCFYASHAVIDNLEN